MLFLFNAVADQFKREMAAVVAEKEAQFRCQVSQAEPPSLPVFLAYFYTYRRFLSFISARFNYRARHSFSFFLDRFADALPNCTDYLALEMKVIFVFFRIAVGS